MLKSHFYRRKRNKKLGNVQVASSDIIIRFVKVPALPTARSYAPEVYVMLDVRDGRRHNVPCNQSASCCKDVMEVDRSLAGLNFRNR